MTNSSPLENASQSSPTKNRASHRVNSPNFLGDAIQITFLLSDWNNFGLSERVCYHYDLIGILAGNSPVDEPDPVGEFDEKGHFHGVVSLLECVPVVNLRDLTRNQRKGLRKMIRDFNLSAERIRGNGGKVLYQPKQLPLRLSPTTRVSFAYEMTRMAFVLDASPTLVSTFGACSTDHHFCALDRAVDMVKTFFHNLARPILTTNLTSGTEWRPALTVTVLAVYPGGKAVSQSILVRDYRIRSIQCAELLSDKIRKWLFSEVETNIALRLNKISRGMEGLVGYDTWTAQKFSSDLRELVDAGDVALDFLPSWARPCIVVATDCRSVACEEILDLFTHEERQDVPIHIMDLSSPSSHDAKTKISPQSEEGNSNSNLTIDTGGGLEFPLYMQDDSESLYNIARATAGCFLNIDLLDVASKSHVGQVQPDSQLALDPFLGSRRRSLRPNALQWYIFFSLSPLTPCTLPAYTKTSVHQTTSLAGRLVPPDYLCRKVGITIPTYMDSREESDQRISITSTSTPLISTHSDMASDTRRFPIRMTFSTYVVDAIRIKGLLLARIKEGFRAKLYGASTYDDFDKVSIQLTLPIEHGTVIHYELQYKARENPLVGVAHVKVELSGFRKYVQRIKNDFLAYTTGRDISTRLCKALWWVRRDDLLQSNLCPMEWGDKLASNGSPFIRRLGSLSHLQMTRHYRAERFDAVCTGRQPYVHDEDLPFSDFIDDGEQTFFATISDWASLMIEYRKKYVRKIPTLSGLTAYCVIEICRSHIASRLFSIVVYTIDGTDIQIRQTAVSQLKNSLRNLRDVKVLSKQMCGSLVKPTDINYSLERTDHDWRYPFLEAHFDHEEWALIKDPELLDLLMRRRSEIGNFVLLHSTESYALLAKDISVDSGRQTNDPMKDVYLVDYQIRLRGEDKEPIINMHVEREVGIFSIDKGKSVADSVTRAHRLFLRVKRLDLECSKALRSRTNLLNRFLHTDESKDNLLEDIERLLVYTSCHSRRLRFFNNFPVANNELERLMVEMMLSDDLATDVIKLDISLSQKVGNQDVGHWFFIRIDRYTSSFIYLPLFEKVEIGDESTHNYRELTFFTFGISDLYCARDENLLDDDEDESHGHISHYLGVEEFADQLASAHLENYARAAYQALRSSSRKPEDRFSSDDWSEIQNVCAYEEVAQIFVNQEFLPISENKEQSKLMKTITRLFTPVPDRENFMFYSVIKTELESILSESKPAMTEEEMNASFDDELSSDESGRIDERSKTPEPAQSVRTSAFRAFRERQGVCFIRFSLDNEGVSYQQLCSIKKSAMLQVHMSVFKESNRPRQMPELQASVAIELEVALKSYIAEQTLERFRAMGKSIRDVDLEVVLQCLRKAREVLVSFFDVHFYVADVDKVVPAGSSTESETEIERCFSLLLRELESSPIFNLRPIGDDCFCLTPPNEDGDNLAYWSFITIKKSLGVVTAEVYHPEGLRKASSILNEVQSFIINTTHRTNQLLLLQNLHRTRVASSYLIQPQRQNQKDTMTLSSEKNSPFEEGHFSCPIVFEESYSLFHRCSVANVISSVVSTTLHSFAVSNRSRLFVYKDESMGIFYLSFEEVATDENEHKQVKFLVFGIQQPGPSVTVQLSRLLQRKILTLEADAWSAVLTKNPHFSWKAADIEFLKTFRSRWSQLDEDSNEKKITNTGYWFKLPHSAYDPLVILMYLRQNLCGSTFFHRLNTSTDEEGCTPSSTFMLGGNNGIEITFSPSEFLLFYNNAPSQLDPKHQACTLTEQGKRYSRQTGSGVALINIMLLDAHQEFIDSPTVSRMSTLEPESPLRTSFSSILAEEVSEPLTAQTPNDCRFFVKVIITDTCLDSNALKDWMFLTLNQSIISWAIERHLEHASTGILRSGSVYQGDTSNSIASTNDFVQEIEALSPGLPLLHTTLHAAISLPHPALEMIKFDTVLKSSSVTSHTVGLLQDCIMASFPPGTNYIEQTVIIRLSRIEKAQIVKMIKTKDEKKPSLRFESRNQTQEAAGDSPIHCPEYLCYFCSELYSDCTEENKKHSLPLLFREVFIGDAVSDKRLSLFSQRLAVLKKERPNTFKRSFAFVLLVKRNTRSLIMYNWDTKLRKKVELKMKELEASSVIEVENNMCSIQLRCLRDLAPLVQKARNTLKPSGQSINPLISDGEQPSVPSTRKSEERTQGGPPRRIQRPTFIRRPKLVEKSMEGGAMQAMAKARAKARAQTGQNRSSITKNIPTSATRKQVVQKVTESEKSKVEVEESDILRQKLMKSTGNAWESSFGIRKMNSDFLCKNWFRPGLVPVRDSVRDLILLQSKPLWTHSSKIMKQTSLLSTDLPSNFTHHLEKLLGSIGLCKVVPTHSSCKGNTQKSAFLMVALKNSTAITFLVYRIFVQKDTMNCDVWMLKFPREDGKILRRKKKSTASIEKRCSSLSTKIGIADQIITNLDAQLFDYSAKLVEKSVRQTEQKILKPYYLYLIEGLLQTYDFKKQQELPRLQYRAFDVNVILKSYGDSFIDKFDAPLLFDNLYRTRSDCMIACGVDSIYFPTTIELYDTSTLCFLKRFEKIKDKMLLVYLCKTEGANLDQYVFPSRSSTAVTIFDLIVVAGARLAYTALRTSAINMHRDNLWNQASDRTLQPSRETLNELLSIVFARSVYSSNDIKMLLTDGQLGLDPEDLFVKMSTDLFFTPKHTLEAKENGSSVLFYMLKFDIFLLFKLRHNEIIDMLLVRREENNSCNEDAFLNVFKNYLLHYLWKS